MFIFWKEGVEQINICSKSILLLSSCPFHLNTSQLPTTTKEQRQHHHHHEAQLDNSNSCGRLRRDLEWIAFGLDRAHGHAPGHFSGGGDEYFGFRDGGNGLDETWHIEI